MSKATLEIGDMEGSRGGKRVIVDCEHGTTTSCVLNPGAIGLRAALQIAMRVAVWKHYAEERCRCTRHLRKTHAAPEEGASE